MSKIEFWLQEHLIARFSGDKTVTGPVKGKLEQVGQVKLREVLLRGPFDLTLSL